MKEAIEKRIEGYRNEGEELIREQRELNEQGQAINTRMGEIQAKLLVLNGSITEAMAILKDIEGPVTEEVKEGE